MPLTAYASRKEGIDHLYYLNDRYQLCLTLTGLNKGSGTCFHYSLKKCNGACKGQEPVEVYNLRVMERAVVQVKNGKYVGFGYTDVATTTKEVATMADCIKPYQNNRDVQHIINSYLKKDLVERVIEY